MTFMIDNDVPYASAPRFCSAQLVSGDTPPRRAFGSAQLVRGDTPLIFMIDNYDSFTYNLFQYFGMLGCEVEVARNDEVSLDYIQGLAPAAIVISPGPGRPQDAGISIEIIRSFSGQVPLMGICLGHQAIAAAFGAEVVHAKRLMHGKVSTVNTDGKSIYAGISNPFQAMRYHSLAVAPEGLPGCLEVTARSEDGEVMGIRHKEHLTEGVQFHPESIMTPVGKRLLKNFLSLACNQETGREGQA